MAENKKSFVLYCDLLDTFKHLSLDQRGEVFTWVLEYVNDLNPEPLSGLLAAVCEPIKQHLKRDLKKFEKKKQQWSEAGKRSAEVRKKQRALTTVKNVATDLTVNDSVSVNVNDINKINTKAFSFSKSLEDLGIDKQLVNDFLKNRKTKKLTNTKTAFNNLEKELKKSKLPINKLMEIIVSKGWGSFKSSWNINTEINPNKPPSLVI